MKRTYLLFLLGLFLLPLNIPGDASAKLYEARLLGVDEETATLVEVGDFEETKMCLPTEQELSDESPKLAAEETDFPAPSGPMF